LHVKSSFLYISRTKCLKFQEMIASFQRQLLISHAKNVNLKRMGIKKTIRNGILKRSRGRGILTIPSYFLLKHSFRLECQHADKLCFISIRILRRKRDADATVGRQTSQRVRLHADATVGMQTSRRERLHSNYSLYFSMNFINFSRLRFFNFSSNW
jgi:hypothetical protein